MSFKPKTRALGLCSGGLDSILAALVLKAQGIEVEWITFVTPFFSSEKARRASAITGICLTEKRITETYLQMLKSPRCGYGKHMNPCLDCHALMFRLAGNIMVEKGFDFLFSGEVAGQRPMSQTKPSLRYVEKQSGFDGYILRPLSAKVLPETIPEREKWVDRNRLLDFSGRSRKSQIALAKQFGVSQYPSPAGGCLLTDKGYANRLRDLFACGQPVTEPDLELLKVGRHIRLKNGAKLVAGRNRKENEAIEALYDPSRDCVVSALGIPSPTVLIPTGGDPETQTMAAAICVGYSKAPEDKAVDVRVLAPEATTVIRVKGISPAHIAHLLI